MRNLLELIQTKLKRTGPSSSSTYFQTKQSKIKLNTEPNLHSCKPQARLTALLCKTTT